MATRKSKKDKIKSKATRISSKGKLKVKLEEDITLKDVQNVVKELEEMGGGMNTSISDEQKIAKKLGIDDFVVSDITNKWEEGDSDKEIYDSIYIKSHRKIPTDKQIDDAIKKKSSHDAFADIQDLLGEDTGDFASVYFHEWEREKKFPYELSAWANKGNRKKIIKDFIEAVLKEDESLGAKNKMKNVGKENWIYVPEYGSSYRIEDGLLVHTPDVEDVDAGGIVMEAAFDTKEDLKKFKDAIEKKTGWKHGKDYKLEEVPGFKTGGKAEKKVAKVMREFKHGKLKTSAGKKVTDRDQAIAIALSEAREVNPNYQKKKEGGELSYDDFRKNFKSAKGFGQDPRLEGISREDLDRGEKFDYDNFKKHGHGYALQLIINNTEGDYSQLSPKLKKVAMEQEKEQMAKGGKAGNLKIKSIEKYASNSRTGDSIDYDKFIRLTDSDKYAGKKALTKEQLLKVFEEEGGWGKRELDDYKDMDVDDIVEDLRKKNPKMCDNTYNRDYWGNAIIYCSLALDGDKRLVFLSMHKGGDVRGNYTPFKAYVFDHIEDEPYYNWTLYVDVNTDKGTVTFDSEDDEAYHFTVGRDETGMFEEGDSIDYEGIKNQLGADIWMRQGGKAGYENGGETKKDLKKGDTVQIIGRRWFQKGPGNTYHSSEVYVNNDLVGRVDYTYGYGTQYLQTAMEILKEKYNFPKGFDSKTSMPWRLKDYGINVLDSVTDVQRKRDLEEGGYAEGGKNNSNLFYIVVDADERGEYRATVYDINDKEVWDVDTDTVRELQEDGYLKYKPHEDLEKLSWYLGHIGIIPKRGNVVSEREFEKLKEKDEYKRGGKIWKSLDFENIEQYYDYIDESRVNGNFSQVRELVKKMDEQQTRGFFKYAREMGYNETINWINEKMEQGGKTYAHGGKNKNGSCTNRKLLRSRKENQSISQRRH